MSLAEEIIRNPFSAVSAKNFPLLVTVEKKDVILKLIDDAVYCDAWEAYFVYAHEMSIPLSDEIAFEAVHAVGLDVFSVHLWIEAARCCSNRENQLEIYHLGLSVPLYDRHLLYAEYKASDDVDSVNFIEENEAFDKVLELERWPDRYAHFYCDTDKIEVRRQWIALLQCMKNVLENGILERDIQIRRMILAYRQMCAQLPEDDSCWYDYCLFLLDTVDDKEFALETALTGLRTIKQDSFALLNIVNILMSEKNDTAPMNMSDKALFSQRVIGEELAQATSGTNKECVKRLRRIGKLAASEGVHDWKVYSQWSTSEHLVVKDSQMASKILENGVVCCSASPDDAILLEDEAIQHHLAQHHEREALGYAEQQVEEASARHDVGRRKAAWNRLVSTEKKLGLTLSKAVGRRNEVFPRTRLKSFLEKVRVGCYLPCSKEEFHWMQFLEDYEAKKNSEIDPTYQWLEVPKEKRLSPAFTVPAFFETVDETHWPVLVMAPNPFEPKESDDPDAVVGPREFCGKLVYRLQVDKPTKARLQREDQIRRIQDLNSDALGKAESPLGRLFKLLKDRTFTEAQKRQLQSLSLEWIITQLISSELNLSEGLNKRVRKT
ncbi:unnamed protein product [Phytomonas sp. EM1]|nr:unnamed protein product [Phytomonas sp. EM1]|eukprot:CCW62225.1 unnamed protein product [Phytomonas sp. isolate EM1]